MKASNIGAVYRNPARENFNILPCEAPVPDHRYGSEARSELEVPGSILLGSRSEADISSEEREVTQESAGAVLHEYAHGCCRTALVGNRHLKVNVLQGCGLGYLPMNAGRHVFLVMIPVGASHGGQIQLEVPDLPEELVLVDVPVRSVAIRDVRITIDQGNSGKVLGSLDRGLVGRMTDECSVVVPVVLGESWSLLLSRASFHEGTH